MSRVGLKPIPVPKGTKVEIKNGLVTAEGPQGKVSERVLDGITVELEDGVINVKRSGDSVDLRARHGLNRALVANAVQGASEGFSKELEINGVGYKAELKGKAVEFALGYSHPVTYEIPAGIKVEVDKTNRIKVFGANRQQVGQVAAEIRGLRKPDPYKAKGIKYVDEIIRRKVGKAGAK